MLYLITFAASLPALVLLDPVLNDASYIVGPGADTRVILAGVLELFTAAAGVGTAIVLFPVVKRQSEVLALGFVAARTVEAAMIVVNVVAYLAVVTLRQPDATGPDAAVLVTAGRALIAIHDWAVLLGQGTIPAVNALLLGTLIYRSGLVPRVIPALGLAGAPLLLGAVIAVMFGVFDRFSVWAVIALAPIFVWELSLGLWLAVKGFRPSPVTAARVDANPRQVEA
ncbi:MAG TPA: DUF4386 domain-containing protein [Actinophytocola sp.]|uniref:DUF4386 domain-containing protein n=1 Tax=Actinophytocola sp. TaxID=1872138 RepID=UPI002DDDA40B|nr:DUF4386 domain-containing protein [Actinophytocola sp.]HEV2778986.1 DUF4386 domain-containing protein [Actinophytocola sp.]